MLFPSPGDLPNPGIELRSPESQADSLPSGTPGSPISVKKKKQKKQNKQTKNPTIILGTGGIAVMTKGKILVLKECTFYGLYILGVLSPFYR